MVPQLQNVSLKAETFVSPPLPNPVTNQCKKCCLADLGNKAPTPVTGPSANKLHNGSYNKPLRSE